MTLASAEGLTETQAKTGATLQLISKMESFTYIVQVSCISFVWFEGGFSGLIHFRFCSIE